MNSARREHPGLGRLAGLSVHGRENGRPRPSGRPHLDWAPRTDEQGNVTEFEFKAAGEAERPAAMCEILGSLGKDMVDIAEKYESGKFALDLGDLQRAKRSPFGSGEEGARRPSASATAELA